MGTKSSSKEESRVDTVNLAMDGTEGATVVGDGNQVTYTDRGAVDGALELAREAVDGQNETAGELFEFLNQSQTRALESVNKVSEDAIRTVAERTENTGVIDAVGKWAAVGLVGATALHLMRKKGVV